MITDSIADMLTRVRNASAAGHRSTQIPFSKQKERILSVLVDEGYVESFERIDEDPAKPMLDVQLRYQPTGAPVVRELRRMSSPGRRWYVKKDHIPRHKSGLGVIVVSTSHGVMSDREARKLGVGGELICSVF